MKTTRLFHPIGLIAPLALALAACPHPDWAFRLVE